MSNILNIKFEYVIVKIIEHTYNRGSMKRELFTRIINTFYELKSESLSSDLIRKTSYISKQIFLNFINEQFFIFKEIKLENMMSSYLKSYR